MKSVLFSFALAIASLNSFAQSAVGTTAAAPASPNSSASSKSSLEIGAAIPMKETMMKNISGEGITLERAMGDKGLLVMFSCNTCPFVVKSQQRTIEVMKQAKAQGIGMIIINSNEAQRGEADSYEAMAEYAKAQGYDVPYAFDERSQVADAFGATRTPEVYLFNARGVLVYKGAMEDNPSDPGSSKKFYLADAMKNMLAGKAINPSETKSIGCSIKRVN